ncbi:DNA helicase B-like [Triplophysa dalaica]|uniref:DNA helicase B-like n=1 Tax=Triplophysa dalaica TaxID=1582913 RepID=UPI0024DF7E98|nr:DNA helicase B-like [Triplophysa dalaica]
MAQQRSNFQLTITGYMLPKEDNTSESEDDVSEDENEEEEGKPEFLDVYEMDLVSSGGQTITSRAPSSKKVVLQVGEEKYVVEGRFPLHDPWWRITCRVRKCKRKHFVKDYLSYSLRTDLQSVGGAIVSLFLKACTASPRSVKPFMDWVSKNNYEEPVTVMNVKNALQSFGSKRKYKAVSKELKSCVQHSDAGQHVKVAVMFPNIMKYLPTLLPSQFMTIISQRKTTHTRDTSEETPEGIPEQLDGLEKLLTTSDVWKLGFQHIMSEEFCLIRCEAKVEAFRQCDLYKNIPKPQQNALLLYEKLKKYCRDTGSTYIEKENMVAKVRCEIGDQGAWEALHFLNVQGVLMKDGSKLALRNLFNYESGIAECLRSLRKNPLNFEIDVREVLCRAQLERSSAKAKQDNSNHNQSNTNVKTNASGSTQNGMEVEGGSDQTGFAEQDSDINGSTFFDSDLDSDLVSIDEDHVKAAEMMCTNPVTVISGKGGSGKTTVVSLVLMEVMQNQKKDCVDKEPPLEILLTAPTGRAASLLTKKNGFKAYTIHQVLWSFTSTKKNPFGEPMEWKFSEVRVLVVDEGSLVPVQLLHSLLSMLTQHAQLQKFIILGDVRQLPSIEPGNTLCDLFNGFKKPNWAIEMKTNHRAESELIVKNAELISDKRKRYTPWMFDATIDMTRPSEIPSDKSFIFVKLSGGNELQNAIEFLLKQAPGLKSDKLSQFLAFKRKDCEFINQLCCDHYSRHDLKTKKNKQIFQINDKVCCTRSGYISKDEDQQDENKQDENKKGAGEKKERLCNGEVFFIKEDVTFEDAGRKPKKRRYLTLDDEDGRVVTASFKVLQKECKLQHAWAKTIHTFQGSETETVVYVLGESKVQNWQHFYTAVTRSQKRVYVVGTETVMKEAITKAIIPRNTRLCSLVARREDTSTQSGMASKRCAQSEICGTPSKRQ